MARLVILEKRVPGLSAKALERFVLQARRAAGLGDRINVLVTGSNAMRTLNVRFRGKDKPTDVLSFPAQVDAKKSASLAKARRHGAPGDGAARLAGEIAISAEIAMQNARRLGHSAAIEVKVLVLHGILHLAGYDHERDNGEMGRKESQLRRKLLLPVTLIERSEGAMARHSPRRSTRME